MLARLEAEPGVESAEVDRRGELLHIRLGSATDVGTVVDRLQEMGFAGELIAEAGIADQDWYGRNRVGELSREEANVIAERVLAAFAQQGHIDAAEVPALSDLVAKALHDWIIDRRPAETGPRDALDCGRTVEEAARSHIGPDRAAALGKVVAADLASRSAFKP